MVGDISPSVECDLMTKILFAWRLAQRNTFLIRRHAEETQVTVCAIELLRGAE